MSAYLVIYKILSLYNEKYRKNKINESLGALFKSNTKDELYVDILNAFSVFYIISIFLTLVLVFYRYYTHRGDLNLAFCISIGIIFIPLLSLMLYNFKPFGLRSLLYKIDSNKSYVNKFYPRLFYFLFINLNLLIILLFIWIKVFDLLFLLGILEFSIRELVYTFLLFVPVIFNYLDYSVLLKSLIYNLNSLKMVGLQNNIAKFTIFSYMKNSTTGSSGVVHKQLLPSTRFNPFSSQNPFYRPISTTDFNFNENLNHSFNKQARTVYSPFKHISETLFSKSYKAKEHMTNIKPWHYMDSSLLNKIIEIDNKRHEEFKTYIKNNIDIIAFVDEKLPHSLDELYDYFSDSKDEISYVLLNNESVKLIAKEDIVKSPADLKSLNIVLNSMNKHPIFVVHNRNNPGYVTFVVETNSINPLVDQTTTKLSSSYKSLVPTSEHSFTQSKHLFNIRYTKEKGLVLNRDLNKVLSKTTKFQINRMFVLMELHMDDLPKVLSHEIKEVSLALPKTKLGDAIVSHKINTLYKNMHNNRSEFGKEGYKPLSDLIKNAFLEGTYKDTSSIDYICDGYNSNSDLLLMVADTDEYKKYLENK